MAHEGPLELGRCVRDDGSDCNGCEVGSRYEGSCGTGISNGNFAPLTPGGDVSLVLSPYGVFTLWLAVRTPDLFEITEGLLEIYLIDPPTGEQVGLFRLRRWFSVDTPGGAELPVLEVVPNAQGPDELLGHDLAALGRLSAAGEERCGTATMRVARYTGL